MLSTAFDPQENDGLDLQGSPTGLFKEASPPPLTESQQFDVEKGRQDGTTCRLTAYSVVGIDSQDSHGRTELHRAAGLGDDIHLQRLINQGARRDVGDANGFTPLHVASIVGRSMCVQQLLDAGATVDYRDHLLMTPLHCAVASGHLNIVSILLKNKALPDATNAKKSTPLHYAAITRNWTIAKLLLVYGATIDSE